MEPRDLLADVVSPELCLVDPELAARARAALPEHPWPPVPRITVERAAPPRVGPRRSFATGFLTFGVVAASVLFGLSVLPTPDRPTFAAPDGERTAPPQQQPPPVRPPGIPRVARKVVTQRPARRQRTRPKSAATRETDSPPRRARSVPRATRRPEPRAERRTRRGRGLATAAQLTRRPYFAWPPEPAAVYYQVRFLRNGHVFYQVQTRVPRLRFPPPIRFPRGRYRWIVRPAIRSGEGVRLGEPIVDSTFRINRD